MSSKEVVIHVPLQLWRIQCAECGAEFALLSLLNPLGDRPNPMNRRQYIYRERCNYCPYCGAQMEREEER